MFITRLVIALVMTGRREHITPVLREPHWLYVLRRVDFKLATFMYKTLHGRIPRHLSGDCQLISDVSRRLRSSDTFTFAVPRTSLSGWQIIVTLCSFGCRVQIYLLTYLLYAGASSLNYVALCTQLSPDAVQRIWGASCNQLHSRVPVWDCHLPTSPYRGQGPSSPNGPCLTPARLRGTHCRAISAKQSIPLVLGSC